MEAFNSQRKGERLRCPHYLTVLISAAGIGQRNSLERENTKIARKPRFEGMSERHCLLIIQVAVVRPQSPATTNVSNKRHRGRTILPTNYRAL